jgi:hypothetical protein
VQQELRRLAHRADEQQQAITVSASNVPWPRKWYGLAAMPGARGEDRVEIDRAEQQKTAKMPSAKPKSPMRLTTKALIAAALATAGRTRSRSADRSRGRRPSQPKNSCTRLSAVTSISMAKVNSDR